MSRGVKRDETQAKARARAIRDPIHGDIPLSAVESAIVDTRIFQRLRYIRQNGLLHFVFPGAVHTRFAHSLGTMHVAGLACGSLFGPLIQRASKKHAQALDYIEAAFRAAALLHDVGHCAFSHSIERVTVDGRPLLGDMQSLFTQWDERDLLNELVEIDPSAGRQPVTHEQIGLALTRRIFNEDMVGQACGEKKWSSEEFGRDVRALMAGGLAVSSLFCEYAELVASLIPCVDPDSLDNPAEDLAEALHSLVSGTLDVDRLDYLTRDSFFCGVPYGRCDVPMLIGGLSLGVVQGRVDLLLHRKAVHALDDMLWSRYQLFIQVLNHKTNVGLNAALNHAIEPALNATYIEDPKPFQSYVAFTDDHVMGNLLRSSMKGKMDEQIYTRILVDRRVPRHLGVRRVAEKPNLRKIREIRKEISSEKNVKEEEIFSDVASSVLVKPGAFPVVAEWRQGAREPILSPFTDHSTIVGGSRDRRVSQIAHHLVHCFSHR